MQKGLAPVAIVIVILVILAGVGGWYFMTQRGTSSVPSSETATERSTESTTDRTSEETDTITDIIGRGENLECDWKLPGDTGENPFGTGKLWTAKNKGRSQITGSTSGMTMEGNAIFRDGSVYTWMTFGGQTMGFKMDPQELADANDSLTPEQKQQAEQIRQQMIFNCNPWTPDESKFTLPSNVTFR